MFLLIQKKYFALFLDSGTGNSVNAWEKPLRSASPKSTSIQMLSSVSETHQSENPSQRNSPHISRDTIDKALLDGSSPPVNTIIFENTNFKSTPNDIMKNQFSTHLKSQRTEKGNLHSKVGTIFLFMIHSIS